MDLGGGGASHYLQLLRAHQQQQLPSTPLSPASHVEAEQRSRPSPDRSPVADTEPGGGGADQQPSSSAMVLSEGGGGSGGPARLPRGRPPGSKNKPKPPVVVTRESEAAMRPVVLELAAGCDVANAVAAFARRRRVGVSMLCGRGAVAAVTLRLPTSPTTASTVTLHGRFEILSLSGTVLPSLAGDGAVPPPFSVSLAGAGGQVIGGTLAGEMTAADGVVVVAATFGNAEVHRLPAAEAEEEEGEDRGGREEWRQQQQQQVMVAPNAGDVGLVGYGGFVGLGGGVSEGQVGHHPQQAEMVLWAQAPASRWPAHPSSLY